MFCIFLISITCLHFLMIKTKPAVFFIAVSVLVFSCRHKKFYEEYAYATGELMSRGWYCAGNVPVDTLYQYYKNGQLSAISVYDSNCTGRLNGITTLFHRNGKVFQTNIYTDGEINGMSYQYCYSGKLQSRSQILQDVLTGDHYEYDTLSGRLTGYTFYYGKNITIGHIEYDSNRNIIRQTGNCDALIRYRTVITNDSLKNNCLVEMINSNPPWRRTQININLFINDSIVIKDSLINIPYFKKIYNTALPVEAAVLSVVQYDSTNKKYHYFTTGKPGLKHYYDER